MRHAETAYPRTELPLSALIDTRHDVLKQLPPSLVGGVALPGLRTGPKRGQGLEFIDLRQYNDGDDVRHIDWNVTARSNQPYTRLYREEKENTTSVVLDFRRHMHTGSSVLRSVRAGLQAARMLWQSVAAGDRVAAIVVTDHAMTETRPVAGRKGALSACELIADAFTPDHPARSTTPLQALLPRISQHARQSGRYIIFSGFDALGEAWQPRLNAVGAAQRTTGVLVIDRLEHNALPTGRYHYKSGDKNNKESTATIDRHAATALESELANGIDRIHDSFYLSGVPLVTDHTEAFYEDTIMKLLRGHH